MNSLSNEPSDLGLNEEVEKFLNNNFSFRHNVITSKTEAKKLTDTEFKELTDYRLHSLSRMLAVNNIRCSETKLRSILYSNFVPTFNPVLVYLNSLPAYDGSTDYIAGLAQTVETTDQDLWLKCFRKWIVAWTASMLEDALINHTVIVLCGEQGIGKSRWISKLVPIQLSHYIFAGTINPDNKDTLIYLAECILINLDEFENLNRNQLGSIKELITKEKVKVRRPYGYNAENLPRRASFVASVNQTEFLSDVTGNRRFLCFQAKKINYEHNVDMMKVFSQAISLYKSGFHYWLEKEDIQEINASNEKFRSVSIEEEALLTLFEACEPDENASYMTNTQILSVIAEEMKIRINQSSKKRLGMALAKYNFWRGKKGGRIVYAVRDKRAYPHLNPAKLEDALNKRMQCKN